MRDWLYSLAFWKGVSYILAGAIALLVYFGYLPDAYLYGEAVILAAILAVLNFIGVHPELVSKGIR